MMTSFKNRSYILFRDTFHDTSVETIDDDAECGYFNVGIEFKGNLRLFITKDSSKVSTSIGEYGGVEVECFITAFDANVRDGVGDIEPGEMVG